VESRIWEKGNTGNYKGLAGIAMEDSRNGFVIVSVVERSHKLGKRPVLGSKVWIK
jgi:hypothetical protein